MESMPPIEFLDVKGSNDKGRTALHRYLALGRDTVIKILDKGADVNAQDNEGNTVLHRAVRLKDRDLIELLLDRGAEINKRNNAGETPLMCATKIGPGMIIYLISRGATDLDIRDGAGKTWVGYLSDETKKFLGVFMAKIKAGDDAWVVGLQK